MKVGFFIVGFVVLISIGTYFLMQEGKTDPYSAPTTETRQMGKEETPPDPAEHQGASIGDENLVEFTCAEGKTITAVFARDILGLTLSDGRQITLRQAESGAEVRYLNNTQTIEFRGRDYGALLIEDGVETYKECAVQL